MKPTTISKQDFAEKLYQNHIRCVNAGTGNPEYDNFAQDVIFLLKRLGLKYRISGSIKIEKDLP
jgi:hypothetical protein